MVLVKVVFLDGNLTEGKARKFSGEWLRQDANFIYLKVGEEVKAIGKMLIVKIEGLPMGEMG